MDETLLLESYLQSETITDAGSGNGLLGIPVAILNPLKRIVLVEPNTKKNAFLLEAKSKMNLGNIEVFNAGIEEYVQKVKKASGTIVARGFPNLDVFFRYIKNGSFKKAVLNTSENKIKKISLHLESVKQKTYNIPLRDNLKILKLEKTARENKKKV